MPPRNVMLDWQGWPGGMRLDKRPDQLSDKHLADAQNVLCRSTGEIETRPGLELLGADNTLLAQPHPLAGVITGRHARSASIMSPTRLAYSTVVQAGPNYISTLYVSDVEDCATYGALVLDSVAVVFANAGKIFYHVHAGQNGLLYVSAGTEGLKIYRFTEAAGLTLLATLAGADVTDARQCVVSDTYAYVADYAGGVVVVDVSDPAAPAKVAGITMPAGQPCVACAKSGDTLCVCAQTSGLNLGGIGIVDVADPTAPGAVDYDSTICAAPYSGTFYDIAVSGTIAYLAGSFVAALDVSNPAAVAINWACDVGADPARAILYDGDQLWAVAGVSLLRITRTTGEIANTWDSGESASYPALGLALYRKRMFVAVGEKQAPYLVFFNDRVHGVHELKSLVGSQLVVAAGNELYWINAALAWVNITGSNFEGGYPTQALAMDAPVNDPHSPKLLIANGYDRVQVWDGQTARTSAIAFTAAVGTLDPLVEDTIARCALLELHEGKVFYATAMHNPSNEQYPVHVFYSTDLENYNVISPLDYYTQVKPVRGQHLTGMVSQQGLLLLIANNTISYIEPGLAALRELTSRLGCPAPRSIVRVENDLYFLDSEDRITRLSGGQNQSVADAIGPWLDAKVEPIYTRTAAADVVGHYLQAEGAILWVFPNDSDPDGAPTQGWLLTLATGSWVRWTGWAVGALGDVYGKTSLRESVYLGDARKGCVYRIGGESDNGTAIEQRIQTRAITAADAGGRALVQQCTVRRLYALAGEGGRAPLTVKVALDARRQELEAGRLALHLDAALLGETVLGNFTLGARDYVLCEADHDPGDSDQRGISQTANAIQYALESAGPTFTLYGLMVELLPAGKRGFNP